MKSLEIAGIVAGLLFVGAAQAENLDLRTIECSALAKGDSQSNTTIAVWLNGYYMGNDDEPIINFDKVNNLGNALVKFCVANPTMKVGAAAEKIMGKTR